MSRLDNFIRSLASPVAKGDVNTPPEETAGDRRRRFEWRQRRRRFNSGEGVVEKQAIERRARAFAAIERAAAEKGGMRKPYDPLFLRDISANAVVQAYVDTMAQDAATAKGKLVPRDEEGDVPDEQLAEWEREIKDLHPELSWRDVIEETSRILLELGDATWVKHYFEDSDDLAEAVVVDSATMFKEVDKYGITTGYMQASRKARDVVEQFEIDEVVWFSWSLRPDRHYGQGPLEKAQNEVELLEELAEKERLDLIAGSQPGVISPDYSDEFGGTVPDEDWDTFVEAMQLDEGERHRVGYSKVPVEFEPINHNYQELQLLERSRYWVTVLGSVFKVNPSYAGFDFENVNRATDESQQEAFKQRGFRVLLRQLEEAINAQLVWPEFSEDVMWAFEREQTIGEKEGRAGLIREQAEAGQAMAEALADEDAQVHYRDGEIIIDDGVIHAPEPEPAPSPGLFGSVDRSAKVDAPNTIAATLTDDEWAAYETHLLEAHASQIQPETLADIEKRAWRRRDDVPEFVREGVLESIDRGAVFRQFQTLPGRLRETLENVLRDSLTQPQGWSLDSITDRLGDAFPGVDKDDLETVARTETTSVLNEAREVGYQERPDSDRFKFYWQGPQDTRTTQLCEDLKIATGQASGTPETNFTTMPGEATDMSTLVTLQREASDHHFPDLQFRRHVPHINCRHTFVRDPAADIDIDVDVPGAEIFNSVSKACGCGDPVDYAAVVGRIVKYVEGRSAREAEIERALGESIIQILRRAFDDSGGTMQGALRSINRRLESSPNYDHDAHGLMSKKTLYRYRDKYEDKLTGVV